MSRTANQARTALTDATVLATYIDPALQALHDSRGGYPTSTPGAAPIEAGPVPDLHGKCHEPGCIFQRPCPDHDGPIHLTQPERDATTIDQAAIDHRKLTQHVRQAAHHLQRAATLAARWGNPAIDGTTVAKQLAAIDRSIWCTNCARHGINNVSEEGRHECRFCRAFRIQWGSPAPKAILEIHAYRTVTPQDATRILDRDVPGWRKKMPKPKTGKKKPTAA